MKVLIVANMYPTPQKPYFGTFVKACVDGYVSQGVETEVAAIRGGGVKAYLAFYLAVFFKCLMGKYDFVHVHYVTHSVPPVYLASLFKRFKVLLNFHGSDAFPESYESNFRRKIKRKICQLALKKSYGVIVPSKYFKEKLAASYDVRNIIVSPSGGVDKLLFKFKAASGRTVLFAGRMIEEKGPLRAAQAIKDNINSIDRIIMVGEGPEVPRVKAILKGLDVEYYGMLPRAELAAKMTEADLFLFPSTREGESLGLVLVEAIFSGCIPIAVLNGAVTEILTNTEGVKFAARADEFSVCVGKVLEEVESFPVYSDKLYRSVENKYSFDQVAKNLVEKVGKIKS